MLADLLSSQPMVSLILQAVVVVGAIFLGVRKGGIALGLWGCIGVLVLAFLFGLAPGSAPVDAMLIVLCVISAATAMQSAGGTDWLVMLASKVLRAKPRFITMVAPIVTFVFVFGAGTGNMYLALLPVIYEVSYANNIRPERPLAASATAAVMATVCSPVSAAMAAMLTLVGTGSQYLGTQTPLVLSDILLIVTPSALIAVVVLSFVQNFIGKPLDQDPEYQRRLAAGEIAPPKPLVDLTAAQQLELRRGRPAALIFLLGVVAIIVFAVFPQLRPSVPAHSGSAVPLGMSTMIELIMATVTVVIITAMKVKPSKLIKEDLFGAGMVSMIALFGIAWLADTFITANINDINAALGDMVSLFPFAIMIALFLVAALTTSQSATTRSIVPIGLALGLSPAFLVAMWSSCIGLHLFPANGTQIAPVELDRTGSTRISKFILWHSFTIPMLIGWIVSCGTGYLIALVFFGG